MGVACGTDREWQERVLRSLEPGEAGRVRRFRYPPSADALRTRTDGNGDGDGNVGAAARRLRGVGAVRREGRPLMYRALNVALFDMHGVDWRALSYARSEVSQLFLLQVTFV